MTPLRPLMQASVKPPSPLLTHQQQPLKPTTPLQPKNTPKTPISHPQRRRRFQLKSTYASKGDKGFNPTRAQASKGDRGFRQPLHLVDRTRLLPHGRRRHRRQPNVARNLSWSFFETPQKHCNSNDANSKFE